MVEAFPSRSCRLGAAYQFYNGADDDAGGFAKRFWTAFKPRPTSSSQSGHIDSALNCADLLTL